MHSSIALSENRELLVWESVSASSVLMEIPSTCFVSRNTVYSTDTGKLLADIIEKQSISFYDDRMVLLLACIWAVGLTRNLSLQRHLAASGFLRHAATPMD